MKILLALSLLASLLLVGCGRDESAQAAPAPKPMGKPDMQAAAKRFTRDEAPNEPHP